jgi:hypothetical protein
MLQDSGTPLLKTLETGFFSVLLEKSVPLSPSPFPSDLTLPGNAFLPASGAALTR